MTPEGRVLIGEADRPTRVGLRMAVLGAGLRVAAEVVDHASAVRAAEQSSPDVALIAADLPGGGIDAVRAMSRAQAGLKLIVLTSSPSGEELVRAVRAGAAGYLAKDVSADRLPNVLNGVIEGEVALPRRHTLELLEALRGQDSLRLRANARTSSPLTPREWEIARLLLDGASTAEIARILRISQVTVRRHASSLTSKLGAADRAGVIALLSAPEETPTGWPDVTGRSTRPSPHGPRVSPPAPGSLRPASPAAEKRGS